MIRPLTAVKYSLIVTLCLLLFWSNGVAQTWIPKNAGQYSGNITAMIFFNDSLYVGTESDGIYASPDRGQNWAQVDKGLPQSLSISSFAVKNDTLFAGTYFEGLYVKTKKSSQWKSITLTGLLNPQITSLLFLNNKLYAGTVNGVYVSGNRKASWQSVNVGFQVPPPNTNPDTWITALCPAGSTIMASDNYRGTYLLQPNGTWAVDTTGMNANAAINALENIQGEIYCGSSISKIYWSQNNGATWSSVGANLPTYFIAMSIGSYNNQLLVGGIDGTLLSSTNNGSSWTTRFKTRSYIRKILVDGTDIFIGTYKDGVYKSGDGGVTWASVNHGLTNTPISNLDNFSGGIYATANQNLYRSDNGGKTWSIINESIGTMSKFNFTFIGDSLIAMTGSGLSFSVDKGVTWQNFSSQGRINSDYFTSLYSYRDHLFAGSGQGIYRFDKINNTWQPLPQFPSNPIITCFLARGDSLLAGGISDVFLSLDHGATWAPINNSPPANFNTLNLVSSNGKLFAASGSGLFVSKDNGMTWTNGTPSNWNASLYTLFSYKNYLFAGFYSNGVYFSNNGGDTWEPALQGFPLPLSTYTFTAVNDTIYAGTMEGVWARDLKSFVTVPAIPTVPTVTEVVNPSAPKFLVYPNPTSGKIMVDIGYFDNTLPVQLLVYDQLGQLKYNVSGTGTQLEADLSNLGNGLFIIKASQNQSTVFQKIIKY